MESKLAVTVRTSVDFVSIKLNSDPEIARIAQSSSLSAAICSATVSAMPDLNSTDAEKVVFLTRPTPARGSTELAEVRDAPLPMLRSRLIEILNAPHTGKELFRQLGVGRVRMLRLRFRLPCGLAERPF